MIYTTIISLITSIYIFTSYFDSSKFFSSIGTFIYFLPFALAGGTIAYLIKIYFINNMTFFGSVGDIIWKTVFWSFIAQIVGAYIGVFIEAAISSIILKIILWIIASGVIFVGFSAQE